MNSKQNITSKVVGHRLRLVALGAASLIVGAGLGYLGGHWQVLALQSELANNKAMIESLYEQAETFDYQQHIANVELGIERAASQSLQQELLMAQDENFALRREITFYQKIMAPELEASGVVIDSLELQQNLTAGHFHFRLAIVQMERLRNLTKGKLNIRLHGRKDEQPASYDLLTLAHIEEKDRQFSMRYFTVQAGDFVVPEGLLPERIEVEVVIAGKNQSLTRNFYWSQLLQPRQQAEVAANES